MLLASDPDNVFYSVSISSPTHNGFLTCRNYNTTVQDQNPSGVSAPPHEIFQDLGIKPVVWLHATLSFYLCFPAFSQTRRTWGSVMANPVLEMESITEKRNGAVHIF